MPEPAPEPAVVGRAETPAEPGRAPARSRGVIALHEDHCTVCMVCARECPDWCIYIESHTETTPATEQGGRARAEFVLDRFAIDYSLCMYCGICVEVCPFDALFWAPDFEYAGTDIAELTHERERLGGWLSAVPAGEVGEQREGPATAPGNDGPGSAVLAT